MDRVLPITSSQCLIAQTIVNVTYATESDSAQFIVSLSRPYFANILDLGLSDFGHFKMFYVSEYLMLSSYRADTSIPTTFVAICDVDSNVGAYLARLPVRNPMRLHH